MFVWFKLHNIIGIPFPELREDTIFAMWVVGVILVPIIWKVNKSFFTSS